MYILSIDIGVINMAYVYCELTKSDVDDIGNWKYIPDVIKTGLVNIIDCENHINTAIPLCECKLYHSNNWCDRVSHFIQEIGDIYPNIVLIERQPPSGFVQVEQLLVNHYRDKMVLISPNALHKHFGIGGKYSSYEWRKKCTVNISNEFLCNDNNFKTAHRQHDIADAMCMIIYYTQTQLDPKQNIRKTLKILDLDRFKFHGK